MSYFQSLQENPEFVEDFIYGDPETFFLSRLDVNNLPTILVFSICMDIKENILQECENTECNCIRVSEIDADKFKNLNAKLVLFNIEKYKDLLFHYAISWKKTKNTNFEDSKTQFRNDNIYELKVSEMLLEVMKNKKKLKHNLELELLGKITYKLPLTSHILDDFEILLIKEFSRLRLNREQMPYDVACREIIDNPDQDFLFEIVDEYNYPSIYGIQDINLIPQDLIQFYADCHDIEVPVTLDYVEEKIKFLKIHKEDLKPQKGAKRNTSFLNLVFSLALLFNFEKFLNDSTVDSFFNFKISNQCFKLIYDFLDYWKLIDYSLIVSDNHHQISYIKSTYKRYVSQLEKISSDRVYLINKIKRVKMGLDNFTDEDNYYIRDSNKSLEFLNFLDSKWHDKTESD